MSIHYYPFINRMMKLSGVRKNGAFSNGSIPEVLFSTPFITVGREPGSGGAHVAMKVAQKLGFEFIDQQIIDELAESTKKRKEIIKSIDEKARTSIQDLIHSSLNKDYISDYKYITELSKVILAYAYKGKVVILGRGANFITPDSKGFHVRITAPLPIRRIRAVKYENLNALEAKEMIAKTEKDRTDFVKKYFKKDIKRASYYDMVLSTSYMSLDACADLVVEGFYKKFSKVERYRGIFGK
ncbi:MAG: cytidylate kinase-like family protein [Candidatus Pacebacteria bacterium]|nr:cytidylate kinase-like family protein [Candidatus Paceibacterota bacterium]